MSPCFSAERALACDHPSKNIACTTINYFVIALTTTLVYDVNEGGFMLNPQQEDAQYILEPLKGCSNRALLIAAKRYLRLAARDAGQSTRTAGKQAVGVVEALTLRK